MQTKLGIWQSGRPQKLLTVDDYFELILEITEDAS